MDDWVGRSSYGVLHNSARGPIVKAQRQGIAVKTNDHLQNKTFPFNHNTPPQTVLMTTDII